MKALRQQQSIHKLGFFIRLARLHIVLHLGRGRNAPDKIERNTADERGVACCSNRLDVVGL